MSDLVTITAERLKELEALEAKVKAKNEQKRIELQKYTDTPEKVLERVKRHIEKDRDAYNARRRERRRLAKEAAAAPVDGQQVSR
jgi:hypothetical protein